MIPSNLVEISGEVFTFSADVGLFDAYFANDNRGYRLIAKAIVCF